MSSQTYREPGKWGRQTRRNLFLPNDLVDKLKAIAERKEISYSELIRQVLVMYVRQKG